MHTHSALMVLLAITLLAFAVSSPVISASKCLRSMNTPAPVIPSMPDPTEADSLKSGQVTEGSSLPALDSAGAPATQSGPHGANPTKLDGLSGAQSTAEGGIESIDAGQNSLNSSQASTDKSTGPEKPDRSTSSKDHATFGDITSASGKCVIGNPNTYVTRKDVDWVWKKTMENHVPAFKNLIFDQLVTNKGSLSYCVRWDNDKKLTKVMASKFQAMIEENINLWNNWLVGYNCWPIDKIDITIVGFAVRDKSIMDWSDDSLGTIYEGILDAEGSPMCPKECYKHRDQASSADTSACKGKPFDMSLWPSTSPGENAVGAGGDWGQRVEVNNLLSALNGDGPMNVLLHEIGHGFGLPDMYVAENKPPGYPACVMDDHPTLTDGDGWQLRSVLEKIKSRYDF